MIRSVFLLISVATIVTLVEVLWASGYLNNVYKYDATVINKPLITDSDKNWYKVAVGAAITSKNIKMFLPVNVRRLPLFSLLESFCKTASRGYEYHFYFGYDWNDKIAETKYLEAINDEFKAIAETCGDLNIKRFNMIECNYSGKPAWVQNDVMMQAYIENMDYFYRVNDDTILLTEDWTNRFIEVLGKFNPPYVGVVGPTTVRHKKLGGPPDKTILTHDFVHRSHIDIFGLYYPRMFTSWFADNWISYVYKPNNRVGLNDTLVNNTAVFGTRYTIANQDMIEETKQAAILYKSVLHRYTSAMIRRHNAPSSIGNKLLVMSLYGDNPRYLYGAIRNAHLIPLVYPGWTLRIYYHPSDRDAKTHHQNLYVPDAILQTLERLHVELIPVTEDHLLPYPDLWRLLVFDGVQQANYAFIRNADCRITKIEADLVRQWIRAGDARNMHKGTDASRETSDYSTNGGRTRPLGMCINVAGRSGNADMRTTKSSQKNHDNNQNMTRIKTTAQYGKRDIRFKGFGESSKHNYSTADDIDILRESHSKRNGTNAMHHPPNKIIDSDQQARHRGNEYNPLLDGLWGGHIRNMQSTIDLNISRRISDGNIHYKNHVRELSWDLLDYLWIRLRDMGVYNTGDILAGLTRVGHKYCAFEDDTSPSAWNYSFTDCD